MRLLARPAAAEGAQTIAAIAPALVVVEGVLPRAEAIIGGPAAWAGEVRAEEERLRQGVLGQAGLQLPLGQVESRLHALGQAGTLSRVRGEAVHDDRHLVMPPPIRSEGQGQAALLAVHPDPGPALALGEGQASLVFLGASRPKRRKQDERSPAVGCS